MYSEYIFSHAPWSFSKVSAVDLCGRQFHRKYLQHKKESRSSSQSKIGVAVHQVTEKAVLDPNATTDTLLVQAVKEFELTTVEHDDAKGHISAIDRFLRWMRAFSKQHGVTQTFVEQRYAIHGDFTKAEYSPPKDWDPVELTQAVRENRAPLIRGAIDLEMITGNGDLIIIDHKSGKHKPIEQHSTQLNIYRLFGIAHHEVRSVQCAIHYLESSRIDWTPPMTREQIQRHLYPWLEVYLNKQHHKLKVLGPVVEPAAETGWQCAFCGFVNECAEGQKELADRAIRFAKKKTTVSL